MLSASFYVDGSEWGHLTLDRQDITTDRGEIVYQLEWSGTNEGQDVSLEVLRAPGDSIRDLHAMALVEVDAILAERAVN